MIKKKSKIQILAYQFLKYVIFIPFLVAIVVYVLSLSFQLLGFKPVNSGHTRKDVNNARIWFLYVSLPFFNQGYFLRKVASFNADQLKSMFEIYGTRRYNTRLKMFVPFIGKKVTAFEAVLLKNGLELEFV